MSKKDDIAVTVVVSLAATTVLWGAKKLRTCYYKRKMRQALAAATARRQVDYTTARTR